MNRSEQNPDERISIEEEDDMVMHETEFYDSKKDNDYIENTKHKKT